MVVWWIEPTRMEGAPWYHEQILMCSMDGCDTAAEACIQLQMGCRLEPDFAYLSANTGRGSGRDGQYLHPPTRSHPKSYQVCKTSKSSRRENKEPKPWWCRTEDQGPNSEDQGRDSFVVAQHSGDVPTGHRGGSSIVYPHCLSNHSNYSLSSVEDWSIPK